MVEKKKSAPKASKPAKKPLTVVVHAEHGSYIQRNRPRWPLVLTTKGVIAYGVASRASDEGRAHARFFEILNLACVDPLLIKSPALITLANILRDAISASEPGEPIEDILAPVEMLMASMRSREGGGGRPPAEVAWMEWQRRLEYKQKHRPTLTKRECYEDIAAEWVEEGRAKKLTWTGVRDGISDLKKLKSANKKPG